MAEAIRDGLRLEAIAAHMAGNGDTAMSLLRVNAYDIAVLGRDIPDPSGDEIAKRAWDRNADPFTNTARITVSALRKGLGAPWIITTVPGVGYRIKTQPDTGREGGDRE
jgi:two-component system response regulator VanR